MWRRGLTMVETILAIVGVVLLLFVGYWSLIGHLAARQSATMLKDFTQVRAIHQAMVMWAQNNADEYPLPSKVDLENATVAQERAAKDTTANIFSMLVANGLITPEHMVSPGEVNRSIRVYENYEYDVPRRAVRPGQALWDPGLSADFTSPGGGNVSYAHSLPAEARLARWRNTVVATEPVVGLRGPEISSVRRGRDGTVVPTFANPKSNTLRILGSSSQWSGYLAFNDNHVAFFQKQHIETSTRTGPGTVTYTNTAGEEVTDLLFYDEPDDATGLNMYMGIFIRAGERRGDFRGIWD